MSYGIPCDRDPSPDCHDINGEWGKGSSAPRRERGPSTFFWNRSDSSRNVTQYKLLPVPPRIYNNWERCDEGTESPLGPTYDVSF